MSRKMLVRRRQARRLPQVVANEDEAVVVRSARHSKEQQRTYRQAQREQRLNYDSLLVEAKEGVQDEYPN